MQFPILLDRSRPDSLTDQLAEQFRGAIRHQRIPPGTRLPSSRHLSEQLGISRNTAVRAYDILIMEGYVEARPASGIYAATVLPAGPAVPAPAPPDGAGPAMPRPRLIPQAPRLVAQAGSRLSFDFFPGRPDAALFPLKTWRRLLQASLSHGGAQGLTQYGDPGGLFALRAALAHSSGCPSGHSCRPEPDHRHRRHPGRYFHRLAPVPRAWDDGGGRRPLLSGRGLCLSSVRGGTPLGAGRRGGPDGRGPAPAPGRAHPCHAVPSISDRPPDDGGAPPGPDRLGAPTGVPHPRRRLRQRLPLRGFRLAGACGHGARFAPSISALFPRPSAPVFALAIWLCPRPWWRRSGQ